MKYVIDLTNDDDAQLAGPSSFGSGRYGFCVTADTPAAAVAAVVQRARRDGFYGADWRAMVVPLSGGRRPAGPFKIGVHVALCDMDGVPERDWWEYLAKRTGQPLIPLPEGGVVLRGARYMGATDGR